MAISIWLRFEEHHLKSGLSTIQELETPAVSTNTLVTEDNH